MGTRTDHQHTQRTLSKKPPKCAICRQVITTTCDWRQGRCPHVPSLADQVINDGYKARFYNLIKFFRKIK